MKFKIVFIKSEYEINTLPYDFAYLSMFKNILPHYILEQNLTRRLNRHYSSNLDLHSKRKPKVKNLLVGFLLLKNAMNLCKGSLNASIKIKIF